MNSRLVALSMRTQLRFMLRLFSELPTIASSRVFFLLAFRG
jgi:hypothetical protein